MDIAEVKRNFQKPVRYLLSGNSYFLTACIMRENSSGEYFYQVELRDKKAGSSLLICRLEDIAAE